MASIRKLPDGRWQAQYRPVPGGRQHTRLVTGTHVDPKTARMTVAQWCETWLAGYGTRRPPYGLRT
jgi:hypothetical protein